MGDGKKMHPEVLLPRFGRWALNLGKSGGLFDDGEAACAELFGVVVDKDYVQLPSVNGRWNGLPFEVAVPLEVRIGGLKYFFAPTVEDVNL